MVMTRLSKKKKIAEVQNLTQDLIEETLLNLPVKSLLRFRCVCRSWFDLISSSRFIERHINHHNNTKNILIFRNREYNGERRTMISFRSYESLDVIFPDLVVPEKQYFSVCGPCNGLICISDNQIIVLCNPATRKFRVLPPIPNICQLHDLHRIGFGFDFISSDYKVVTFGFSCEHLSKELVHIYNLSTNSWRKTHCGRPVSFLASYPPRNGSLCKGALHWLLQEKGTIISFDLNKEIFRYMEVPREDKEGTIMHLIIVNESLALFEYFEYDRQYHHSQLVNIWIMHEYGVAESWTNDFTVGPLQRINRPLMLWKNEAIIVDANGRLFLCDFENFEMNEFFFHGDSFFFDVMIYRESLIHLEL